MVTKTKIGNKALCCGIWRMVIKAKIGNKTFALWDLESVSTGQLSDVGFWLGWIWMWCHGNME